MMVGSESARLAMLSNECNLFENVSKCRHVILI